MKKVFAIIVLIAAMYVATAYDVEINIHEKTASALCHKYDPRCF